MIEKDKISIQFRVWFFANDEKLVGKGRVELLEHIRDTGSITHAARAMKMSYRQAWQMVQEMNERFGTPLVKKQLGGKLGGGAELTAKGDAIIRVFKEIERKMNDFLIEEANKLKI